VAFVVHCEDPQDNKEIIIIIANDIAIILLNTLNDLLTIIFFIFCGIVGAFPLPCLYYFNL
jgi:hypothetical protein